MSFFKVVHKNRYPPGQPGRAPTFAPFSAVLLLGDRRYGATSHN